MNVEKYIFEVEKLDLFCNFLRKHYDEDNRIENHIKRITEQINEENPFYEFGTIQNFLLLESDQVIGHCSAIIDKRNKNTGLIGFYDCIDDEDASKLLLSKAVAWLKKHNCIKIEGPVNLTIWHNYRFIISHKRAPAIFDPVNKDYYPKQWKNFGFSASGKYVSAIRQDFNHVIPLTKHAFEELSEVGLFIREFEKNNFIAELEILRKLANKIFQNSWNFVELSQTEFSSLYNKVIPLIDGKFIEIIEDKNNEPVGFCFSMPNPSVHSQVIMKTIGVIPELQRSGIGAAMLYSQHKKAQEQNFKEFYYPLIRVGNNVTKLPYEGYEIITEYQTYMLN